MLKPRRHSLRALAKEICMSLKKLQSCPNLTLQIHVLQVIIKSMSQNIISHPFGMVG
uniref:Uncharacterized protein n=1 Tax=Nymphaea colorata TaxID=210225 RepID=A0A5K1FJ90_9MAGN